MYTWQSYPDRLHLQEFTSKSQEDCRKDRTSALIAAVRAAIPAIILEYPALTVLKASLQRSWCGLLGVRHQNSHGSEAKIRAAWFLEAAGHFTYESLIQRRGSSKIRRSKAMVPKRC